MLSLVHCFAFPMSTILFALFQKISHPNIVSVFDVFEIDSIVFIFMEICEHGDLLDYIRNKGALPENRAKNFFR